MGPRCWIAGALLVLTVVTAGDSKYRRSADHSAALDGGDGGDSAAGSESDGQASQNGTNQLYYIPNIHMQNIHLKIANASLDTGFCINHLFGMQISAAEATFSGN